MRCDTAATGTVATGTAVRTGKRRAAHNVAGKSVVMKVAALGVVMAITGAEAKVAKATWYEDPACISKALYGQFGGIKMTGTSSVTWIQVEYYRDQWVYTQQGESGVRVNNDNSFTVRKEITGRFNSWKAKLEGSSAENPRKLYWKSDSTYYNGNVRTEPVPTKVSAKILVPLFGYTNNLYSSSVPKPEGTFSLSTNVGSATPTVYDNSGSQMDVLVLKTLTLKDEGNGTYSVLLPNISVNCSFSQTGEYHGGVYIVLSGQPSAQLDNRSVTLSRSEAPTPKQENDSSLDKRYDDWIEADGTVHGHTTRSYRRRGELLDDVENLQTIHANRVGSWGTISSWNWVPATTTPGDTVDDSHRVMPFGGLDKDISGAWVGTPKAAEPYTVTYNVTDASDKATATAKYELTVHDEVEKVEDKFVGQVHAESPLWGSDANGGADTLFHVDGLAHVNDFSVSQGHGTSSGWTFVLGGEFEFDKIKTPLGLSAEYNTGHSYDVTTTSNLPFEVPIDKFTYPVIRFDYNRRCTTFHHFTSAGEHVLAPPAGFVGPWPDHPLHEAYRDIYTGAGIIWQPPVSKNMPYPERNAQTPPPLTPHP